MAARAFWDWTTISGRWLSVRAGVLFLTRGDVSCRNAKCSGSSLTLVAFGEKLIREYCSTRSQVQVWDSLRSPGVAAQPSPPVRPVALSRFWTPSSLTGDTPPLTCSQDNWDFQGPWWLGHSQNDFSTALTNLNLECRASNRSFCSKFLSYLRLTSNSYQNNYKGNNRRFHSPLTTKTKKLKYDFFLLLWDSFQRFHCVEIGFI